MHEEPLTATATRVQQRRGVRSAALIALMVVTACALWSPLLAAPPSSVLHPTLPWWVLAAVWMPFELVVLYLQFGDDPDNADTFVLTEIPLALGLLLCPPVVLIAVAVLTPVLIDLVRQNKSATKQVFNGANRAVEVGVAVTLYLALEPRDPLSPWGWGALCLVVVASSLTTSLLVSAVIGLSTGRMPLRESSLHGVFALPMAVVGATLAFSGALALQRGVALAAPLVVALVALLLLLRGFTLMTERHVSLIRLHSLGQRLGSAADVPSIVHAALDACSDLLGSREATVVLPAGPDGSNLVLVTEGPAGQPRTTRIDGGDLPQGRGILRRRTAVVAAAPLRAGREVVLSVAERRAPVRPYRREDLRVLEMAAHQTAQALHTAHLIEKLRHDALHDPLTDLPNRRSALVALEERLADGDAFAVACIGLSDLEKVNAALGHEQGDQVLVEVARRLGTASGAGAMVARIADDSFAVLLPHDLVGRCPEQQVTTVLSALSRAFTMGGADVFVRTCAGVVEASCESSTTGAELLRRADIAMRHARATGGSIEAYVVEHETATAALLSLAADLRTGIPRGELVLHAQPQVRLADGAVAGMEMLVRWNHPTLGLLQPGVFIPLAEQSGLEASMTAWVLEAAITAMAGWREDGLEVSVSVNVPTSSLASRDLCHLTEGLLVSHRVPGDQLVVEITETGLFTNIEAATDVLHGLTDLGVRISIDDFGTGFSSMSRLRHLPVDEIKIDRSFVATMVQDRDDEAIVRSIIDLAQSMGLVCVAEGIEDAEVYDALQHLGCDLAQGYLMARPMPTEDVVGWCARRQPVASGAGVS